MIDSDTVIVVGAGGSAEFGLPTGAGLFRRLQSQQPYQGGSFKEDRLELSGMDLATSIMTTYGHYPSNEILDNELIKRSKSSFEQSIDLLSFQNSSIANAAKFFSNWHINANLIEKQKIKDRFGDERTELAYRNDWKAPYINDHRNWIASVVQSFVSGADSCDDINPNKLKIISFNYDQIFIDAFRSFLKHSERFEGGCTDVLPEVLHVYGKIEFLDPIHPRFFGRDWEKIKFIRDFDGSEPHIKLIRDIVFNAKNIYVVGFAFDPKNVELIGLNECNGSIYTINYDGSRLLENRLKKMNVPASSVLSGSVNAPLALGVAAEQQFFSMHEY